MGRPACPKEASVALEIEIKLCGVRNVTIDDSARRTVTTPISLALSHREEADVVPFADNDDGDFREGVDAEFLTRLYVVSASQTGSIYSKLRTPDQRHLCDVRRQRESSERGLSCLPSSRTCLNCPSETPSAHSADISF